MNDPTAASPPPPEDSTAPDAGSELRFADLGLSPEVLRALGEMGFERPMPVQRESIPRIASGRDLLVQSRTGSGKTAAFGIPLVDRVVDPAGKHVQAIVLLPTRELALQVASELTRIAAHKPISVVPIYGGAPMGKQVEQLRAGAQVVCGTPGRILDHLRRGTLVLDRVRCAILDECDEMLSMGFQEDIEAILEHTPKNRQTLLYSATVPEGIERLSRRFLRDPERLKLSRDFVGVQEITHLYYSVGSGNREADLLRVLQFENPVRAIVFCNTREETGRVAEYLRSKGLTAEAISSDLTQDERERVMAKMRAGGLQYLVATDVAARGIDLDKISHVVNYTFPESAEVYIHRTGRTGRAGKHGIAVSLIGPAEIGAFYYLKLLYKIQPQERALPSAAEIQVRREGELLEALRRELPGDPGPAWRSLARRVQVALDGERLLAALLAGRLAPGRAQATAGAEPRDVPAPPEEAIVPPASQRPEASGAAPRPADRTWRPERERPARAPGDATGPRGRERDREREGRDRAHVTRGRDGRRPGERARFERERPQGDRDVSRSAPAAPVATPSEPADYEAIWSDASPLPAAATQATDAPPRPVRTARVSDAGPGQTRLYLNLGRKDGATADEIADLAAGAGVTVALHDIDVMNTHTYLNVDAGDAARLADALTGRERQGRRLACEAARPRQRS